MPPLDVPFHPNLRLLAQCRRDVLLSLDAQARIRRGSFHTIVDLETAIKCYLAKHNAESNPFVWTASAASILAKPRQAARIFRMSQH
jgi:hypothetical protein